jgi:hypothetical protein
MGAALAELEIRLILVTILQRYVPVLLKGGPLEPLPLITLRLAGGLAISLAPATGVSEPLRSDNAAPVVASASEVGDNRSVTPDTKRQAKG